MLSLFLISFLKSIFSLISCFEYLSSLSSGLSTSSSESISSFRLSRFTGEQVYNINIYRAENFTIVYIEVNAWSSLLVNFKINLILSLYQQKCIELNQSSVVWTTRTANQRSREIWNFARHLMSELSFWKSTIFFIKYAKFLFVFILQCIQRENVHNWIRRRRI